MSFLTDLKGERPDIHTDPRGWEESWNKDLEHRIRTISRHRGKGSLTSLPGVPRQSFAQCNTDECILQHDLETRLVCERQSLLALNVQQSIASDDFEAKWRALSHTRREEIVLEGICNTFIQPDMRGRRTWCPETTLKHLTSSGGETYLRLLKHLSAFDPTVPHTNPILVPHDIIDSMAVATAEEQKIPGSKSFYLGFHLNRSYCITGVAWRVFLAFYGASNAESNFLVKPMRTSTKVSGPSATREYLRKNFEEYKVERKTGTDVCWRCCQPTPKLMACGKCRAMGRKVLYCSQECQKDDWSNGSPRPHKFICGKPLTEDEMDNPRSSVPATRSHDDVKWMPDAEPTFVRSSALLNQVSALEKLSRYDYLVIESDNQGETGIRFPLDAPEKLFFLIHRNRAFRNGDLHSIRAIYTILCHWPYSERFGVSGPAFRKQLKLEYGIAIPSEAVDVFDIRPIPSTEEIRLAFACRRVQLVAR